MYISNHPPVHLLAAPIGMGCCLWRRWYDSFHGDSGRPIRFPYVTFPRSPTDPLTPPTRMEVRPMPVGKWGRSGNSSDAGGTNTSTITRFSSSSPIIPHPSPARASSRRTHRDGRNYILFFLMITITREITQNVVSSESAPVCVSIFIFRFGLFRRYKISNTMEVL